MNATSRAASAMVVAAALVWGAPTEVRGHDDDASMNRVSFDVRSTRQVANDWVKAVVAVTHEDPSPAEVAGRINRDMDWALELARGAAGVRAQSGGYHTYPVEDPKRAKLRRWRGTQQLVLESADADDVSELVGALQSRLQLQSIGFSVSRERRRELEDELIAEALAAFQARAELVRRKLGAAGYEIVQIQVSASGGRPPPRPMRAMAMGEAAAVAPPALEAGTSELVASASGTIELVK
jgi:predicted secreted protein